MTGTVYKSTGSWYSVRDDHGKHWNARVKGKLKIDTDISSSNPIAVGDTVIFEPEGEEGTAIVSGVKDRRNYIVRVSPQNRNQKHIVAANLDLAIVVATLAAPRTSMGFVDRFLITAEAYHIPALIVMNKADALDEDGKDLLAHWQRVYATAGYEILPLVALEPASVAALHDRLGSKTVLFSGHSGVGKSTLINALLPDLHLRTKAVSDWSGKGQHTTTFAEMFDGPGGSRIIDTPGVKEFGLIDLQREELSHYFPEMRAMLPDCRFNNCLHLDEPGCAVKAALGEGSITTDRYASYLGILETVENKW
jgi:ribosome biogenesis GTPase